ncbi:MAG: MBL fold metallo-hydrolase [Ruminococcaceae bacterium]|nr:MBL fold metallo-hydrolase [Oscillospiraceae bacterium]
MIIQIHRGQNQIGGLIIEISDGTTRLFFDIGINLSECERVEVPQIDGLFCGDTHCDGVFISHYHADHIGLTKYLLEGIPVYMGERAYGIISAASEYREKKLPFEPTYIYDRQKIVIGEFSITPYLCDHSAFDSYMFLVENGGKKVLYTGDFRANGRLDFDALLNELPVVDALITEGTTLSRENKGNIQEELLEQIAIDYLKGKSGPAFIMMSAQNIDRLITAQNIADQTDRILLQDIYTAQIAKSCDVLSPKARVFMTGGDKQYEQLQVFNDAKIGKHQIAKTPFLMCIRQSMKNYLSKLNDLVSFEDGVLFYGMWKGYMEQSEMQEFLGFMVAKGVKVHILHTSGHADAFTIDQIIEKVCPQIIIPVHTENAEWFYKYRPSVSIREDSRIVL